MLVHTSGQNSFGSGDVFTLVGMANISGWPFPADIHVNHYSHEVFQLIFEQIIDESDVITTFVVNLSKFVSSIAVLGLTGNESLQGAHSEYA